MIYFVAGLREDQMLQQFYEKDDLVGGWNKFWQML